MWGSLESALQWLVIFLVLDISYYNKCEFKGIDAACFYGDYFVFGDYQTNSEVSGMQEHVEASVLFMLPCSLSDTHFEWGRCTLVSEVYDAQILPA